MGDWEHLTEPLKRANLAQTDYVERKLEMISVRWRVGSQN